MGEGWPLLLPLARRKIRLKARSKLLGRRDLPPGEEVVGDMGGVKPPSSMR